MLTKPRGPTDKLSRRNVSHPIPSESSVNWSGIYISVNPATLGTRTVLGAKPVRFSFRSIPRLAQL